MANNAEDEATMLTVVGEEVDPEAAYTTKGHVAAVSRPRFTQAHQQFFSPRWLAEAGYLISCHAFGLDPEQPAPEDRRMTVLDPTVGSARLLAPFHKAGHYVLGIDIDARLVTTARHAVGKDQIRHGDIVDYGNVLPYRGFDVITTNPPYGIQLPMRENGPYYGWELVGTSGGCVESQVFVLSLIAERALRDDGLLVAILSGRLLETNPHLAQYLGKQFQQVAVVTIPHPFKAEYGIDVNALLFVGVKSSPYSTKKPAPLTGEFSGDRDALVTAVNEAYDTLHPNPYYGRSGYYYQGANDPVARLHLYRKDRPQVPQLEQIPQVDTAATMLRLTARGVNAGNPWSAAWLKFLSGLPMQAYDQAQGCYAPVGEAFGSLPNVLMAGVATSQQRLQELGFTVEVTPHAAEALARRAKQYERERLPLRDLMPMEYLAWYPDGPITAKATVTMPDGTVVPVGATYDLRVRWYRSTEEGKRETKGEGKSRVTVTTSVDRGFLILRFAPLASDQAGTSLVPFEVREVCAEEVQALVQAFDLPVVPTAQTLPTYAGLATRLQRFMEQRAPRLPGNRQLFELQAEDVAAMGTRPRVGLLYEQGGGKTSTIAHWMTLRGYRTACFVTVPSGVAGIIEDLHDNWDFPAQELTHTTVDRLWLRKQRRRQARGRVKTAVARVARLEREKLQAETAGLPADLTPADRLAAGESRLDRERRILATEEQRCTAEAQLAQRRRHLRNLEAIARKGKARDVTALSEEISQVRADVARLTGLVQRWYQALGYDYEQPGPGYTPPRIYVTGYTDICLGDHVGVFDPWKHDHYDRDGNYTGSTDNIRSATCPTCGTPRAKVVLQCPACGEFWHGEGNGGGRVCRRCGHVAWTVGRAGEPLPVVNLAKMGRQTAKEYRQERVRIVREARLAGQQSAAGQGALALPEQRSTSHQWPVARRIKKLFPCVALDEAQDAKSKSSLRGAAARAIRGRGRAILTGTWIKGYCHDLFWTAGWLFGFGSPLWPFPYHGGSGRFLEQFGTYKFVTREYKDSLEVGKRSLIPSVSNLGRLWRLLAPVTIRRLKEDFLPHLPKKSRNVRWVSPTGKHAAILQHVAAEMEQRLNRELAKDEPSMGIISMCLWWGRFAAACPNLYGAPHYAGAWGHRLDLTTATPEEVKAVLQEMRRAGAVIESAGLAPYRFPRMEAALEYIRDVQGKGEKVIVFTSLRGVYKTFQVAFHDLCIPYVGIDGVPTGRRVAVAREWEASDATVLLAGLRTLNRAVTITVPNHELIYNLEWSPEDTLQAEDRIHRPGQTRDVDILYLLSPDTVDAQMYDLVQQKAAAQRAVQDREAQIRSVEQILADAALANAQLAVAKAVVKQGLMRRGGLDAAAAEQQADQVVSAAAERRVRFGTMVAGARSARRSRKPQVQVMVVDLWGNKVGDAGAESPGAGRPLVVPTPATGPVQLAFFE